MHPARLARKKDNQQALQTLYTNLKAGAKGYGEA
jgi:hypothetical protein